MLNPTAHQTLGRALLNHTTRQREVYSIQELALPVSVHSLILLYIYPIYKKKLITLVAKPYNDYCDYQDPNTQVIDY